MTTDQTVQETCDNCAQPFDEEGWNNRHSPHDEHCEAGYGAECTCEPMEVHAECCTVCDPLARRTPAEQHRPERGHDFYPSGQVLARVPKLYATEATAMRDKVIHLHYFVGACDWWLVEYDAAEALGFGYVCLGDPVGAEWGLVPLVELEAVRVPLRGAFNGLSVVVERDLHWRPKTVGETALPGRYE